MERKRIDLKEKTDKNVLEQIEPITVQELLEAKDIIVKCAQKEGLPDISSTSSYGKLDPFVDPKGVTRVGGRLKLSSLSERSKHPAILPRDSHITLLVIRHFHNKVKHQGRGMTANEIRASGYWIMGASTAISSAISKCV